MDAQQIIALLQSQANPSAIEGMARYGINPHRTLGVSMPALRALAKEIGRDHRLAQELWRSGIHEARILASLVADPQLASPEEINCWVAELDSWDVCDQLCSNLLEKTPFAWEKAVAWSDREDEFVRRAGFVLMARLAVSRKRAKDDDYETFFTQILRQAGDERNFVKKAINWALRQIGKRSPALNQRAIQTALQLQRQHSRSARWIAADALRELQDAKTQARILRKNR